MKKQLLTLSFIILCSTSIFAKKVKFAVDMAGQILSPNGIHVSGDFQVAAGYPSDWDSGTTTLLQEGSTTVYSIVVDIPAFAKYEYKFVNGDQFYEVEFVPVESRVGYLFNDNRWLYIDSVANDTTFIGALLFGGNAPAGKKLARFYVDMNNVPSISPKGVYIAGTFQNPVASIMYNFAGQNPGVVYEVIAYFDSSIVYEYKFHNGNTTPDAESVPLACATINGGRQFQAPKDTMLSIVCFSSCTTCTTIGISENTNAAPIKLYPNPTSDYSELFFDSNVEQVYIVDAAGRVVKNYSVSAVNTLLLKKDDLNTGTYFITVLKNNKQTNTTKWIVK